MSSQSLDGSWHLGRVPQQPLTFRGDDSPRVTEWLPATVPGNIHADLMRAGRLPDLYRAAALPAARWVEEWDWWLERPLSLSLLPGQRAFLQFDGIDYLATLWLDDHLVAHHEGAFSRHTVEITPFLQADGHLRAHRLGVRFWGARAWPAPAWRAWERLLAPVVRCVLPGKASLRPFHPRLRLLRPPMQAGWDFAPALAAIGLWEGVRLLLTGGVWVAACRVALAPSGAGVASLSLDAASGAAGPLRLAWEPENFTGVGGETAVPLPASGGRALLDVPFHIQEVQRWHPWEQGAANLYRLTVHDAHGNSLLSQRLGVRTVQVERMRLTVNEQPFFARGVNWVPADSLPGTVARARYETLLGMARERGVNLVRVWGGGGRERRTFYDLCDEMGLLVWQEFPFACAFLDHYPRDREFLARVEQEAQAMVRELRHHPALALWGAGNEFSYQRNRPLVQRLAATVRAQDERPFLPPSPAAHDRHNWHVWHGRAPLRAFLTERTAFLSEFGLQAPPAPDSLARFLPPAALWPPSEGWSQHHAELPKLFTYTPQASHPQMERFVAASQSAQAVGVQLAVEQMRRRKAAGAGGVALWQWNEPWPAISWALVDYFGVPKRAAEQLGHSYAPLLLCLDPDLSVPPPQFRAALWAINDLASPFPGCEARIFQGETLLFSTPLALPPHSARRVADLRLTPPDACTPLRLELWQNRHRLALNTHPLVLPGPTHTPRLAHLYRTLAEWIMRW